MITFIFYLAFFQFFLSLGGAFFAYKISKLSVTVSLPWFMLVGAHLCGATAKMSTLYHISQVALISDEFSQSFWIQTVFQFFAAFLSAGAVLTVYLLLKKKYDVILT